jgi:hypothetical protein
VYVLSSHRVLLPVSNGTTRRDSAVQSPSQQRRQFLLYSLCDCCTSSGRAHRDTKTIRPGGSALEFPRGDSTSLLISRIHAVSGRTTAIGPECLRLAWNSPDIKASAPTRTGIFSERMRGGRERIRSETTAGLPCDQVVIGRLLGHRGGATRRPEFVRGNRRVNQVVGGNKEIEQTPRSLPRERTRYVQLLFAEHVWSQNR